MKEIIIVADKSNSSIKGSFYENLVNKIFKSQRYQVTGNVNFTGMEFDLLCKHLDRTNEISLVECKVKDKLSAEEITKFAFNVDYKKYNYGFFLYTKKYGHQVAGLIEELKNDPDKRYEKLYFWDATKVIELLVASNQIKDLEFPTDTYSITKTILLYSYIGNYYITILSNSTIPTHFAVFDAKSLAYIADDIIINKILNFVNEIQSLSLFKLKETIKDKSNEIILETVAEIQESDSWYDYKPASSKYFVGRKKLESDIMDFFSDILMQKTSKRIFYLDGKSGWGKSSFLNQVKGKTRNKHNKNKYFTLVIDSRSANSQNFIALGFKKLLDKASKINFIDNNFSNIKIQSLYNILQSDGIDALLDFLKSNNKLLIIVFDQFEDVFRKGNIFKGFYKLLIDVVDKSSNIALGFSWKTEVNIPIEHEAYSLWQQSKDFAKIFSLDEFDLSESRKIVNQLEKEIKQKLDSDFIRKIIDNSQGFPWLVKKLCVHIFDQYKKGVTLNTLYNQDFNVELLFKEDLQKLDPEELRALNYIAERAFNNDMLDEIEINEIINQNIRNSLLLDKKMIIKTGTKYNIYWDIFRDYLVKKEIPKVGETYILRYTVSTVFELLSAFKQNQSMKIDEILKASNITIAKNTAGNILRELRTLGLIIYEDEYYSLRNKNFIIEEIDFINYLKDKLSNHSFYLELLKIKDKEIEISDLANIIKSTVKSQKYTEKTLLIYAQTFISWINYSGLEIPNINPKIKQNIEDTFTPQNKPDEIINFFNLISNGQNYEKNNKKSKLLYDLKSLGFLTYERNKITFYKLGNDAKVKNSLKLLLIERSLLTEKIRFAYEILLNNPGIDRKEFKNKILEKLISISSKIYANSTGNILFEWAIFIMKNKPQ